jgi:hypothetical protein
MKKILLSLTIITILVACSTQKKVQDDTEFILYEVLFQSEYLGSEIKFYELVTEPNEFKMLLAMKPLKGKISEEDISTSNFLLLNSGMKSTGGYSIGIESIVETPENIVVTVLEQTPKMGENVTMAISYPMCVVKINSNPSNCRLHKYFL